MKKNQVLVVGGVVLLGLVIFALYDAFNRVSDAGSANSIAVQQIEDKATDMRELEEAGRIEGSRYINEELGLSFRIPEETVPTSTEEMHRRDRADTEELFGTEAGAQRGAALFGVDHPLDEEEHVGIWAFSPDPFDVDASIRNEERIVVSMITKGAKDQGLDYELDTAWVTTPVAPMRRVAFRYIEPENPDFAYVPTVIYSFGRNGYLVQVVSDGFSEWPIEIADEVVAGVEEL